MSKKPPPKVKSRLKPLYPRTFIREWREHRGLSLEELADQATEIIHRDFPMKRGALSFSQLSRIESRAQPYSQPMLEAVAVVLKVPTAWLLMMMPPKKDDPDGPDDPTPDPTRIWSVWEKASDDERQKIATVADTLVKKASAAR